MTRIIRYQLFVSLWFLSLWASPALATLAKIDTLFVNADGDATAWVASSGSDFQCVDETTADDADWVRTGTDGAEERFALENFSDAYLAQVDSVVIKYRMKSLLGINDSLERNYKIGAGSVVVMDTVVGIGGSFAYLSGFKITTTGWTDTDLDGLAIGMKCLNLTVDSFYCSHIFAVVYYETEGSPKVIDTVTVVDTVYPVYDGFYAGWSVTGPGFWESDNYADVPKDDDVSYVNRGTKLDDPAFDNQLFRVQWRPQGLVSIDTVQMQAWVRNTGTGAFGRIASMYRENATDYYMIDSTATIANTFTLYTFRKHTLDTTIAGSFNIDSVNNIHWGWRITTAPGATRQIRVTEAFLVITWQQRRVYDTLDIELADNWLDKLNVTFNNGADTLVKVGDTTARIGLWLDSASRTSFENFIIDTAILVYQSVSVTVGNHDAVAYTSFTGSRPGTAVATAQSGSSSWNSRAHGAAEADLPWQIAGCDSTTEGNGTDRALFGQDSIRFTAVGSHQWRVEEWVNNCISDLSNTAATWTGAHHRRMLLLRDVTDTVMASMYSRNYTTWIGKRPHLILKGHGRFNNAGNSGSGIVLVPCQKDTVKCWGAYTGSGVADNGRVRVMNIYDSAKTSTYRHTILGGVDSLITATSPLFGMMKEPGTSANNTDWNNHYVGAVIQFASIYRDLLAQCIGDQASDTSYIDSVHVRVHVATKDAGTWYSKWRGPLLQRWAYPGNNIAARAAVDSTGNYTDFRDSTRNKVVGCLSSVSGADGDVIADFDTTQSGSYGNGDSAKWDYGFPTTFNPIVKIPSTSFPTAGNWFTINVTNMFKVGLLAQVNGAGNRLLDTMGFQVLVNWTNDAAYVNDSFPGAGLANCRFRMYAGGSAANGANGVQLNVFIEKCAPSICADEDAAYEGIRRSRAFLGVLRDKNAMGIRNPR